MNKARDVTIATPNETTVSSTAPFVATLTETYGLQESLSLSSMLLKSELGVPALV